MRILQDSRIFQATRLISGYQKQNTPIMNLLLVVYMLLLDPKKMPKSRLKTPRTYLLRKNLKYLIWKSSQMVYQELILQINRIMKE